MQLEYLSIIDLMIALYEKPRNETRFAEYLKLLGKEELILPIGGFNPMAKGHVLEKLQELKNLGIEKVIDETIKEVLASKKSESPELNMKVTFNLQDDLLGGWTNRFLSDYKNKFDSTGLTNRNFIVVFLWVSENYTAENISTETQESIFRTVYQIQLGLPKTLNEHLAQEVFVQEHLGSKNLACPTDFEDMKEAFEVFGNSEDFTIIFNLFYGDEASEKIGHENSKLSLKSTGFEYAQFLANN